MQKQIIAQLSHKINPFFKNFSYFWPFLIILLPLVVTLFFSYHMSLSCTDTTHVFCRMVICGKNIVSKKLSTDRTLQNIPKNCTIGRNMSQHIMSTQNAYTIPNCASPVVDNSCGQNCGKCGKPFVFNSYLLFWQIPSWFSESAYRHV